MKKVKKPAISNLYLFAKVIEKYGYKYASFFPEQDFCIVDKKSNTEVFDKLSESPIDIPIEGKDFSVAEIIFTNVSNILFEKRLDTNGKFLAAEWTTPKTPQNFNSERAEQTMADENFTLLSDLSDKDVIEAYGLLANKIGMMNPFERGKETLYDKIKKDYPVPTLKSGYIFEVDMYHRIIYNVIKKRSTIITGVSGIGKTSLVEAVAKALNIPCYKFDLSSIADATKSLIGTQTYNGKTTAFTFSRFSETLIKNPHSEFILLLDEFSRASPFVVNMLIPLLDPTDKHLYTDIAAESGHSKIKLSDKAVVIATANIGYSGTYDMDRAILDRFAQVEMTFPEVKKQEELLQLTYGLNPLMSKRIVSLCTELRELFFQGNISNYPSMRAMLNMAESVADGFPFSIAATDIEILYNNDGTNSERTVVNAVIQKLTSR